MKAPILALLIFANAGASIARADCYDVYGCTDRNRFSVGELVTPGGPNCSFLYVMRNRIYAQHGYCFSTAQAIQDFGNQGCVTHDANRLGLSAIELANAATILQAEKVKRCPE